MNSTEVSLTIQDVISSKKHVYFFHLYSKILCFGNFPWCQTTLFVCHQTKENLTCVGRGRCPQPEIDIHSNSRLDNDFHSTLVVYRKSFPIYGVAEKHGIGEKQKKGGMRISSIRLLRRSYNELTILPPLQQLDYFKQH